MCEPSTSASGHDDDLVVAKTVDVETVLLVHLTDPRTQRANERDDLLVVQLTAKVRLLHVKDLASQRQDRLVATVASLLRRAARGVTLDNEDFALGGSFS